FRELDQLKRGDELVLYAGGQEYAYTVDEVLIVPEKFATEEQRLDNVRYIQETKDDRLTLVSCWPRNDNTHRIIVVAKPEKSVSKK
ncbi:MAG: sortase, partial [Caldilinea sp.]|nr:sortase [Caldilinea sp.]